MIFAAIPASGVMCVQPRTCSERSGEPPTTAPVNDGHLGFVDGPNLYAYCNQNAWSKFDPDGLSVWLKAGKLALKGGDMALTVAGFVDDWHTFTNPESTFLERFGASWSMLSEVLPVSVDDVKGGISITKKAVHSLEESKNASKLSKTEQKIVKTEKEVAKESEKQVEREFKGGTHGDMKKPVGDGLESHHMPADSTTSIPREKGPAIQMDPSDHALTSSHGSNGLEGQEYRQKIREMVDSGKMRDAMAEEIRDVRRAAKEGSGDASKYNKAMQQMLDSAKENGHVPSNPNR